MYTFFYLAQPPLPCVGGRYMQCSVGSQLTPSLTSPVEVHYSQPPPVHLAALHLLISSLHFFVH